MSSTGDKTTSDVICNPRIVRIAKWKKKEKRKKESINKLGRNKKKAQKKIFFIYTCISQSAYSSILGLPFLQDIITHTAYKESFLHIISWLDVSQKTNFIYSCLNGKQLKIYQVFTADKSFIFQYEASNWPKIYQNELYTVTACKEKKSQERYIRLE